LYITKPCCIAFRKCNFIIGTLILFLQHIDKHAKFGVLLKTAASPVHADYISTSNSQTNTEIIGTAYNRGFNPLENNFNNTSELDKTPVRRNLNINFEIENTPEIISSNMNNIAHCISVEWDYEHPCLFCNCIYLKCKKIEKCVLKMEDILQSTLIFQI